MFHPAFSRALFAGYVTLLPAPVLRAAPRALPVLALLALVSGCYDQPAGPIVESDGRVFVTNDEAALASRVHYVEEAIPVDAPPSTPAGAAAAPARAASVISLTLVAEVDAPELNGDTLQATSVSRRTQNAMLVSYNVRGDTFLGGVDYVINWFGRYPSILSSATFNDSDVSAVALEGSDIYAAQATNASGFATSAAIERLRMGFLGISVQSGARFDLTSFAATSVAVIGDEVWVTTGDAGDVYALDRTDLATVRGSYTLDDARWVTHDEDGSRVVVVQGTPGRISTFSDGSFTGGSLTLLNTFSFNGATVPESKSTVDVAGGKAFIAAGEEGVQVMCLDDGTIVGNVPRPDPAALGLDSAVVVTNAVTVDGDLMFISNGEAGVYIASGDQPWADTACTDPQTITLLGQLRFDDLQSANHVDYRNGYLFVAAGLGGVKVVEVNVAGDDDDDDD